MQTESMNLKQIWPRTICSEILKLKTHAQMKTALANIKPPWHDWVQFYLNDWVRKAGGLSALKKQIKKENEKHGAIQK